MKIEATFKLEVSNGLHGEDIEDLLKDMAKSHGGELLSWK